MDYKWSIEKVITTEGGMVTHVYWRCEAQGFACSGIRNLVLSDSFTAYNELTEQQVLNWCFEPEITIGIDIDGNQQSMTKMLKNEGEAQINSQIQRQSERVKNEPALPWATSN